MRISILQAAVAALAVSGPVAAVFGSGTVSVSVTPTRPADNAILTWDVSSSPSPNKQNNWVPWTKGSSEFSPGQSFLMPETRLVSSFSLQLNSSLTSESIVRNSSGDAITVALETYPDGGTVSPSGTVGWPATPASFTGNLPANFDDNATNYGAWVTFTFDSPVELVGGNYYGMRLYFDGTEAAPNDGGHDIKFNTGYWGDSGATTIDGRLGAWTGGGYSAWDWQPPGVEDLQFVLTGASPPTWSVNSSGDWNVASNWNGAAVPNGAGAEARLLSIISSSKTVYTDTAVTLGTLRLNNTNTYVISGSGSLILDGGGTAALVDVQAGTQKINLPLTIASDTTLNVATGATLKISDPVVIASGKALTPTGAGSVVYESTITLQPSSSITIASASHVSALTLQGVSNAVVATSASGSPTLLQVDALSIDAGSKLDLKNNSFLVNSSPSTVRALIKNGSIDSTSATLTQDIGYLDAGSGKTAVLYTLLGDLNLDRQVDSLDFSAMVAGYGMLSGANWSDGDVNYDDKVNTLDFNSLAGNFGVPFASAPSLGSVVPEPSASIVVALGAVTLFRRRQVRR